MLNLTTDEKSPFDNIESHLAAIAKAGGQRYETIQVLSAGIQQILGTGRPIKLIQSYTAMVSKSTSN